MRSGAMNAITCREYAVEVRTLAADLVVDGGSHVNGVAWAPDLDAAN